MPCLEFSSSSPLRTCLDLRQPPLYGERGKKSYTKVSDPRKSVNINYSINSPGDFFRRELNFHLLSSCGSKMSRTGSVLAFPA